MLLLLLEDDVFHINGKVLKALEPIGSEGEPNIPDTWEEVDDNEEVNLLEPRFGDKDVPPRDVMITNEPAPEIGIGEFVVVIVEVRAVLLVCNPVVGALELKLAVVRDNELKVGRGGSIGELSNDKVGEVEASVSERDDILDDTNESGGAGMLPVGVSEPGEDDTNDPLTFRENVAELDLLEDVGLLRSLVGLGSDTVNTLLLSNVLETKRFV